MHRLKNLLLWLMIGGYLVLSLGFVRKENDALKCSGIEVLIRDSLDLQFIRKEDVMKIIEAGDSIAGKQMSQVELSRLEEQLRLHPAVKTAELYTTIDGILRVEIRQRTPVVRIIDRSNRNYYIDGEGFFMPATPMHSEYVLVANGNIPAGIYEARALSLLDDGPGSDLVKGMFELARYIYEDEVWHSQIVQVYVNEQNELELIPRLGAHVIYFGPPVDYRHKLFKLETVYKNGFRYMGWNQYEIINLKYKNQVVCTKK
jgi:cell division protein FtsQ